MRPLIPIFLAGLTLGCTDAVRPRSVPSVISAWSNLGAKLTSKEDVAFIRDRLPGSLTALRAGFAHQDEHVRMSSAFVAEELGSEATSLASYMIQRLQSEPIPIVRVYLASALAEVGHLDSVGVGRLEDCFRAEQNGQSKTEIAGALVRLCSAQDEPVAWQWLLQSLEAFPPDPPEELGARHDFWERRWSAAKHLRTIRGREDAVLPLLKGLQANRKTPDFVVDQQVSGAIADLESRARPSTD